MVNPVTQSNTVEYLYLFSLDIHTHNMKVNFDPTDPDRWHREEAKQDCVDPIIGRKRAVSLFSGKKWSKNSI